MSWPKWAVGVGISSHEGALETHRYQEWGQGSRRRTANDQYALSGSVLERHERGIHAAWGGGGVLGAGRWPGGDEPGIWVGGTDGGERHPVARFTGLGTRLGAFGLLR